MSEQSREELDRIELLWRVPRRRGVVGRLRNRAAKRRCLAALILLFLADGVLSAIILEHSTAGEIVPAITALLAFALIFCWCLFDANERNYHINLLFRVLIILFPYIGIPAYLLKTRGLRGFFSIALMVLFVLGISCLGALAYIATCLLFGLPMNFN